MFFFLIFQNSIRLDNIVIVIIVSVMPAKPQDKWRIRNNNATLCTGPHTEQVNDVYQFCHNFPDHYSDFTMLSYQIAPTSTLSRLQFVDNPTQLTEIIQQIAQNGYLIIDTISDFASSYKGWISLILIGFNNKGYIIDALALREQTKQLKRIIQDSKVTKFCNKLGMVLDDTKRQWGAFGSNFFDFELFEKSIGVKKGTNLLGAIVSERPIYSRLQQQLQERYDNMIKYIAQIKYILDQEDNKIYNIFAYSNHYEILLKEYRHHQATLQQEEKQHAYLQNQKKRKMREEKENACQQNQAEYYEDPKDDLCLKNDRERLVCSLLIQWRQHMAKILDCPLRQILTFHQILVIAIQRPSSILQIQDILLGDSIMTIQMASKILQLLSFQAQHQDNTNNELQVRSNKRNSQEKNIKSLLNQLKWEGREEWLNRKNDESIKLYKEIVSIVELDGSVVGEFIEGMGEGVVGKSEIGRFVKYAEFMRNGNHRRLKEYFEANIPLQSGWERESELEGWQSEGQDCFIIGRKTSNSQTSIAGISEKISEKGESQTSATIRCPSSLNSLHELDLAYSLNKIDPLPENIEEIYLKAVNVKKNYQKIQKKKGGRRENKEDCEFVPSWQQIKVLLDA